MHRNTLNLKEIERRAYRSTFQDGLWDIYLGLVFTNFALGALLDRLELSEGPRMALTLGYFAIIMVLFIGAKRYVTMPRMGQVRFGPQRKRKLNKARIVLGASVLLGLAAFLSAGADVAPSVDALVIIFAANILIVLGATAYFMDYERLYLWAILFALSLPVGEILKEYADLSDPALVFFVSGGIATVTGALLFIRFLRDYPISREGAPDDEG